jgi:hypothetical protein
MNSNRRILIFVLSSCLLYVVFSLLGSAFHFNWPVFKRINLIADVITKDSTDVATDSSNTEIAAPPVLIEKKASKDFTVYVKPHFITNFNIDTAQPALLRLMQKLHELKKGKKRKIRIGYFGDSMIEGDLLTQTLRTLLQGEFGGSGVGFVPVSNPSAKLRQTVTDNFSEGWEEITFKNAGKNNQLFLSGYLFRGGNDWVEMRDHTIKDSNAVIEKRLFYGYADAPVSIKVNDNAVNIAAKERFGNLLIGQSKSPYIKVAVADNRLPVYGISFETESGIIVDNFSFRGISGVEFNAIDSNFLKAVAANNNYDLLVFQYGVNVLFRPNDKNFNWYARMIMPAVKKLKSSFSNADFIVISTADRAFRYDGEYKSAIGIDSLIKIQATIAYETGACFYNQFETMGGHNSIVQWADTTPSLANKDYVHPNHRGAAILAQYFFDALMKDYKKYTLTQK